MLDPQLLRKDLEGVLQRLATRKNPQPFLDEAAFRALEAERKAIQTCTEELQAQRNAASKQIGQRKAREGHNPATQKAIKIPASKSPAWRVSKQLKERVNSKKAAKKAKK